MSRCTLTENLRVYYKEIDGGKGIDNAQVLCHRCNANTPRGDTGEKGSLIFSNETEKEALKRAGNRCECERDDCHTNIETQTNVLNTLLSLKY
jgi:hypothetical protein